MLKALIMKVMGFDRISFGDTYLYYPKKTKEEVRFVLKHLSETNPTCHIIQTATNPQDYNKPHTLVVLQSSDFDAKDVQSLENAFSETVKKSWKKI